MRPALFSALIGLASHALLARPLQAWAASGHMLRTLRGWALAAFLISLAMEYVRPARPGSRPESKLRQAGAALAAFALLACFIAPLIAVRNLVTVQWAADALTLAGGGLIPTIALMALESPHLRPRSFALAGVLSMAILSLAGFSVLAVPPVRHPGTIRTHQPTSPHAPVPGSPV